MAGQRFLDDLQREDLELHDKEAVFVLGMIERTMVHKQGEALDGTPLLGKPLIMQPWQVFCIYNLVAWYYKGTKERRYKEAFIFIPRKNGKTTLIAGLAWAVSIIQRRSGSVVYIVANALKQAMQAFQFIKFSLEYKNIAGMFQIKDNSFEHSIKYQFHDDNGQPDGSIEIQAMPANPESQDSFNSNFSIVNILIVSQQR